MTEHRPPSSAAGREAIVRGGHLEKLLSGCGAFIALLLVYAISARVLSGTTSPIFIASVGASAVLLFALPHSPLSQPWPVLGGHLVSSFVGVSCARYLPDALAVAAAVGGAITIMYYLRCLHPPGGATALAAVIGGEQIQSLGFTFMLTPVLLDIALVVATAVVLNYAFPWRRYPLALAHATARESEISAEIMQMGIRRDDLRHALAQMDLYVDVTEHDLEKIYSLAMQHAKPDTLRPVDIVLGRYFSNGANGDEWSVRRVIDESGNTDPYRDQIIYRTVAGKDKRTAGTCPRLDFAHWARYEVEFKNNQWQRVSRA